MAWEVDWSHPDNTGTKVWARNPTCHIKKCRKWRMVSTYTLRRAGVNTPIYRKDSWEIDWSKRKGKMVWARNPHSKMPKSRDWHWIEHRTLDYAGIKWRPFSKHNGRYINTNGYVTLTRKAMTDEEIELAHKYDIFKGARKTCVWEHQLVAVKKYGKLPRWAVVRHLNGDKEDNRPENLVLGTVKENSMDHRTAVITAMYWREKYDEAQNEIAILKQLLDN